MSILDKKFKLLLDSSEENIALKDRVTALEVKVEQMSQALGQVMKSYVELAKMTVDHRLGLEEVYTYLTSENNFKSANACDCDKDHMLSGDEPEDSPEEIARKRMMN